MSITCPCAHDLYMHLPITGIIRLISEYCHRLSFKLFQRSIQSSRFFASTNHQGYEIEGQYFGSFFDACREANLTWQEFPILRTLFRDSTMEFEQVDFACDAMFKLMPVLQLEEDWYNSLMNAFSVNERYCTWAKLMHQPCSIPRTFDKICDMITSKITEIVNGMLINSPHSVKYTYLHE
jgi:hypothetical protein